MASFTYNHPYVAFLTPHRHLYLVHDRSDVATDVRGVLREFVNQRIREGTARVTRRLLDRELADRSLGVEEEPRMFGDFEVCREPQ